MKRYTALFILLIGMVSTSSWASPWVEANDPFLRASIEQLAAAGYLQGHRTTYPLMWSGIARDLSKVNIASLNEEHLYAFYRVRAALEFSQRSTTRTLRAKLSSESEAQDLHQNTFADTSHDKAAITSGTSFTRHNWAGRLQTTFSAGSANDKNYHFIGSYLATTLGNWALSADQMPVWWGPAHENALVLSTNSLPIQALRINRLSDEPLPGLSILGHVHTTAFIGRTQSSAQLGDNMVGGGRITVRPFDALELGASYIGHSEGESDFYNQIAGLDARLAVAYGMSVYGEVAANRCEAEGLAYTVGVDTRFARGTDRLWQLYAEYSDIPELFYDRSAMRGVVIEEDGYRRWDYNIGAAQDQDVGAFSIGIHTQRGDGRSWSLKVRRAEYGPTNLPVSLRYGRGALEQVETYQIDVQHQRPYKDSLVTFGLGYRYDDVSRRDNPFGRRSGQFKELSIDAGWEFRF